MYRIIIGLVCLIALIVPGVVSLAQDQSTPTPPAEVNAQTGNEGQSAQDTTLEGVTGDSTTYYGKQVTLDGVVEEFVNARAFVLAEGVLLDDDKVLVINNTPEEFDLRVASGQHIQITGTVLPSLEEDGFGQLANGGIVTLNLAQVQSGEMNTSEPEPTQSASTSQNGAEAAPTSQSETTSNANQSTPSDAQTSSGAGATPMSQPTTAMDANQPTPNAEAGTGAEVQPSSMAGSDRNNAMMQIDLTTMHDLIAEKYPDYTILDVTSLDNGALVIVNES